MLLSTGEWNRALAGSRPDVGTIYRMSPTDVDFHVNLTRAINSVRRVVSLCVSAVFGLRVYSCVALALFCYLTCFVCMYVHSCLCDIGEYR